MLSSKARPASPFWPESTPTRGRTESQQIQDRPSSSTSRTRSTSTHGERRPMGPRAPSPLPSQNSGLLGQELEITLSQLTQENLSTPTRKTSKTSSMSTVQQSRRPLEARINEATPRGAVENAYPIPNSVEPLAIKKKSSLRSNKDSPPRQRQSQSQIPTRSVSTRKASPQARGVKRTLSLQDPDGSNISDQLLITARTTQEDVCI